MSPVSSPGSAQAPTTSVEGPSVADQTRSQVARVRFRRALTLMLMTLVLPGSAQLVAGNKRVGRIALRVCFGLLASVLFLVGVGFVWNGFILTIGSSPLFLGLLRLVLVAAAVGWAYLFIDAWRLGRPLELVRKQRLAVVGLNGALVFAVVGALLFASHLVAVQRDLIVTMFGNGVASSAEHGRYNVLLIGGDAGQDRWGLRTDSMTVASIDEETGRTILFGLPRNMTNFPFPEDSVMAKKFPRGYDCETCTLNSLATWAGDHRNVFADSETPGVDATIQGVEGITGLKINYYVLVNMKGFRSLVNAMGGVTLNVRDRIPIGLPITDYIEPGVRKLNGFETLWFARSRESADDYSRMARQKCVMSAMVQQLSPTTVISNFQEIAQAGQELVQTNLPASELDTFAELALKARSQKISSVSFVPPAINTGDPDIDKIRDMIDRAVERAEGGGGDGTAQAGKGFSQRGGVTTGGSIGSLSGGYKANQSQDLAKAC